MEPAEIDRRTLLKYGALGGLALAVIGPNAAHAADVRGSRREFTITDLGPGVVAFALAAGVAVGDVVYIQTRNMDPVRLIGLDLRTQRVVSESRLSAVKGSQAVCGDNESRYVYVGTDGAGPCVHRVDTQAPNDSGIAVMDVRGFDVQSIHVAPDGMVLVAGRHGTGGPMLWQLDPVSLQSTPIGAMPDGLQVLAGVAATDATVYAGGYVARADGSLRSVLIAVDRATGATTSILPPEMAEHAEIRDVNVIGDRVVAGSRTAGAEPSHLAFIDVSDHASYTLATGVTTRYTFRYCGLGGKIYFAGGGGRTGIGVYDPATNACTRLDGPGIPAVGFAWDLSVWEGKLVATSVNNFVAVIDTEAMTSTTIDLLEAGARPDPQMVMGVAADERFAYVGGNSVIIRHDLATGETLHLPVGGESKDMLMLGGVLYTAQYNPGGIFRYDPDADAAPVQIASLPAGQNRGLDVAYDDKNGLLAVGARSDTLGAGSIGIYELATGTFRSYVNPIDDRQMVRTLVTKDGVLYLGGDLQTGAGTVGTIVAFDPVAGSELWRLETGATRGGISGLAIQGKHLFVAGSRGEFFVVDLPRRAIVHRADLAAMVPRLARLTVQGDRIYGISDSTLFQIDRRTFEATAIATLNGSFYSGPSIGIVGRRSIYTMQDRNLVKVELPVG